MASLTLNAEGGTVALTPFVMARTSHHFFTMSSGYDSGKEIPLARLYLFCASIEIGLKAGILADECTEARRQHIKGLGHRLMDVWASFQKTYGQSLWDAADLQAVAAIAPFFKNKGLEYFTIDVLVEAATGATNLPDVEQVAKAAAGVNSFLVDRQFFKNL